MMKRSILAFAAATASTAVSAATLSDLASNVEASGWISASYAHSFIDEDLTSTRALNVSSDSFELNQAVLNLGTVTKDGFGGFVSVMLGEDAASLVNPSYGENTGDKVAIPEAYLSYASGAWTIKAGRFATLAGYEVASDATNPLLSRALQFAAAEPFYHTGVRVAYAASESTTVYLGLDNSAYGGFADDTNEQKTVEAGFAFAPSKAVSFGLYDYYGVENDLGAVNYLDAVASVAATDKLTLALNLDWYSDDFGDIYGVAGYATYHFTDRWATSIRLESLKRDFEGGARYTIDAATVDLAFTPAPEFRVLVEARVDDANQDIFVDDSRTGSMTGTQPTVGIKAIYSFGL
jgi:Putative beta-barrel porin-2, OmpL-like. bbp2